MATEKTYELSGHQLLVIFDERLVRIKQPINLQKFLTADINQRSEVLVNYIKQDYFLMIGKELQISNNSLIVEIWGHVYAGYLAKAIKQRIKLKPVQSVANLIIHRSDTIDCGEAGSDTNRKLWDVLANFKGLILKLLPNRFKV